MNIPGFAAIESIYNTKYGSKGDRGNFGIDEKILPQKKKVTDSYWDDNDCLVVEWEDSVGMVSGSTNTGICL